MPKSDRSRVAAGVRSLLGWLVLVPEALQLSRYTSLRPVEMPINEIKLKPKNKYTIN